MVTNSRGKPPPGTHPVLGLLGQAGEGQVARGDLVPGRGHADLGLVPVVVAHPDRPEHGPGRRPGRPVGHLVAAGLDPDQRQLGRVPAPGRFAHCCMVRPQGPGQDTAAVPTIGLLRAMPLKRSVEGGAAQVEDAAVPCGQPVAPARGIRGDPHDGRDESRPCERALWSGVPVAHDCTVRAHGPVAAPVGRGGEGHDRRCGRRGAGRAVEVGVTEGEHPAVGGDHPVAIPVRCGDDPDDRLVERRPPH